MGKIGGAVERDMKSVIEKLVAAGLADDGLEPEPNPEDAIGFTWCDGQSFERQGGFKKRTGRRWRNLVPFDGPCERRRDYTAFLSPSTPTPLHTSRSPSPSRSRSSSPGVVHEHAHAIFAYMEMYWQSFLFWAMSVLKRERVHEIMQSLDDCAYRNYQEAISEVVVWGSSHTSYLTSSHRRRASTSSMRRSTVN